MSYIRDINLAPSGNDKIEWVRRNMPLLRSIHKQFEKDQPFKGLKIGLSIHLEAKTAYLCRVLAAGGAEMHITGSNPLSTQDDVAAALAADGLNVYAFHGADAKLYDECIEMVVKAAPDIIIDDGGDILNMLHNKYPELEKCLKKPYILTQSMNLPDDHFCIGEITNGTVNKGTGIGHVLSYYGGSVEDTIGIGDSSNDIPMFRAVHHAIAMGNATPVTKEAADWVTADIGSHGILIAFLHENLITVEQYDEILEALARQEGSQK